MFVFVGSHDRLCVVSTNACVLILACVFATLNEAIRIKSFLFFSLTTKQLNNISFYVFREETEEEDDDEYKKM